MMHSKQRTAQHLIDEEGQRLLKSALPASWVVRDYRPDYGVDFAVEVFKRAGLDWDGNERFETLGEHVFVQLKSCKEASRGMLKVFPRFNVEKTSEAFESKKPVGEIETIRFHWKPRSL